MTAVGVCSREWIFSLIADVWQRIWAFAGEVAGHGASVIPVKREIGISWNRDRGPSKGDPRYGPDSTDRHRESNAQGFDRRRSGCIGEQCPPGDGNTERE
jgi:hypothetical protein